MSLDSTIQRFNEEYGIVLDRGLKMNIQQAQQLETEMQKVHNSLANALVSLHFVNNNAEAFSPVRRVMLEKEWQRVLAEAIIDLSAALTEAHHH